jgi:HEAT repeat protein
MATGMKVNWEALAETCGAVSASNESSDEMIGREGVAEILGEEVLKSAVDHYVGHRRGSGIALSVLHLLRPRVAVQRCLEIYDGQDAIALRRSAVELLRYIGDWRQLEAIKRFLADPDAEIQAWGASFLKRLILQESVSASDAEEYLQICDQHENPQVRHAALRARAFLSQAQS